MWRVDKLNVDEQIVTSSYTLNRTITEKMKRISKVEVARACTCFGTPLRSGIGLEGDCTVQIVEKECDDHEVV